MPPTFIPKHLSLGSRLPTLFKSLNLDTHPFSKMPIEEDGVYVLGYSLEAQGTELKLLPLVEALDATRGDNANYAFILRELVKMDPKNKGRRSRTNQRAIFFEKNLLYIHEVMKVLPLHDMWNDRKISDWTKKATRVFEKANAYGPRLPKQPDQSRQARYQFVLTAYKMMKELVEEADALLEQYGIDKPEVPT